MSLTAPAPASSLLLSGLQNAYDRHQFFEAWQASAGWWTPATDIGQLSIEELIFGARLAARLGGGRLSRSLFLNARNADPTNPLVRYFTDHLQLPRRLLLDELMAFEAGPELGGDDAERRANWLASHAYTWARLRNMPRAFELLAQAHTILPNDAWLYSVESDVLGIADDWPASLASAERSWELDPRSQWAAYSVASALMNVGQIGEAVRRLELATDGTQSAQLLQSACWYKCALAETLEGDERAASLARARDLAARIEPLAPLADREFKAGLARTWLDLAQLTGDHAEMERWSAAARSPFHRHVLANLERNPAAPRVRLPYRRNLQRHAECVPTSVASALSASGIEISVAELAAEVTFGGTAEWAAADWLREKGFHVRFFTTTADTAARLIDAGIGFVITWEDDDSGHAVAVVGMDHAAGVVLVHDPTSFRMTEYLLSVLAEGTRPFGVLGMAAVVPGRAAELDSLLPPDAAVAEAAQAQQKALTLYGPSAAQAGIAELTERFPRHPGTHYLQAIQDLQSGRIGQALASMRTLFDRFPNAPHLRSYLIFACRAVGNTSLLRQTLQAVVETGSVPGAESHSDWVRPHPRYVAEYADLLRNSTDTRREAEALLRAALRTNWTFAQAWHILADLRWDQKQTASAELAYHVASCLASHNEHYARAYADVLSRSHKVEEGLDWLAERARQLGGSAQGIHTWISWIDALESHGYPHRALEACSQALAKHATVPALLGFAVPFYARMGMWAEAAQQLAVLEADPARAAFHEAAVAFYRMQGDPQSALGHAQDWVIEQPRSMQARYALLGLIATLEGQSAAAACAQQWMQAHPGDEDFEAAFCQYAEGRWAWRKIRTLRARVQRNRDDAWAWRELLFHAIGVFEMAGQRRRERLQPVIERYLAAAARVTTGSSATVRGQALWKEDQGDWPGAVEGYVESIQLEPDHMFAYRRAWQCAARLPSDERRALWQTMQPLYIETADNLPNALEMMGLLAARFGVRETEEIVAGWQAQRPDDPNVLEAATDLLLNHGHGRTDTLRAVGMLRTAVERFPYHSGLRYSLARAHRALGEYAEADEAFKELVRRRPDDNSALIQLAWIQQHEGQTEQALETLARAQQQAPREVPPRDNRAQILLAADRRAEALTVIDELLELLPESAQSYERSIALFNRCTLPGRAVEAARQGTQVYPHGAYLWLLLGRTLKANPQYAATGEVEACLRTSLRLNRTLFDAADWLAMFLVEQHRYDEARTLMREIEPSMADPSTALGRMAWIRRASGETQPALDDLAAVVRDAPSYTWGWNLLLAWLEEDKRWELGRTLLDTVPAPMLTDLEFRQGRLQFLEKAKAAAATLDPEWTSLLADFPDDTNLFLTRYDLLWESGRRAEAGEVIRRAHPQAPENPWLLARLTQVEFREKDFPNALEHGLAACFAKTEQGTWPANYVWSQVRTAGFETTFAERFLAQLKEGARPSRRSLALYAEETLGQSESSGVPRILRESWLNFRLRRFTQLMRLVEQSSWQDGEYLADMLRVLNRGKYRRPVIASWKRMLKLGLDANTDSWGQTGQAMISLDRHRAARALLGDWRTRTGVELWMLTNYVSSLSRLSKAGLAEVIATCDAGLTKLPHDHCTRMMAYLEVEARALAGDRAGVLAAWAKYTHHFTKALGKAEFYPPSAQLLARELPKAVRALEEGKQAAYGRVVWGLRLRRVSGPETRRRYMRYFVFLLRALIAIGILASGVSRLFQ